MSQLSTQPILSQGKRSRSVSFVANVPQLRKRQKTENQKDAARARKLSISKEIAPRAIRRSLPFARTFTLSGAVAETVYTFRGNSCFDPDFTGVGSQPMGFDQYMAIFGNYRVHGSKIKVVSISSIAGTVGTHIMVYPTRDSAISSEAWQEAAAQAGGKEGYAFGTNTAKVISTVSHNAITASTYNVRSIDDESFGAAAGASPANEWFWHINFANVDGTQTFTTGDLFCNVQIIYDVEFYNGSDLNLS